MFELSGIKSTGERFLREMVAIAQGLRIKIYEDWQPELDEVLFKHMPEGAKLIRMQSGFYFRVY